MTTTANAPLNPDEAKKEKLRAYHRNYYRQNPEAARKNQHRVYEHNQRVQLESKKRATNNGKTWTASEIDDLIELYHDNTQREIAYILGRTVRSVQKKAKELGLRKNARRTTD